MEEHDLHIHKIRLSEEMMWLPPQFYKVSLRTASCT
jgi:hypothetical protein